jgi:hypothetical protein
MFKRGGPSYQAQGTGITSPFDTPRKQYQFGTSFEEIQENIRKSTADNTTTMQDVAQGFSYLANPYKDDGSAKTVGEMIFEGSQAVSGARGERKKTAQAGELAAQEVGVEKLKSDIAISEAEKERKSREKIASMKTSDEYLKKTPLPRLILDMTTQILKTAVPGSFEYKNASGLAKGKAIAAKMASEGITVGVIEDWVKTKDGYDYNADNMRSDMAWFDPTTNQWHVYNDNGNGYVTGDPVKSFLTVEEAVAYLAGGNQEIIKDDESIETEKKSTSSKKEEKKEKVKIKITTNLKDVDINDREFIFSEAEKVGITLIEPDGTKTWSQNLAPDEMTFVEFKKVLEDKKMSDTYANIKPDRFNKKINVTEDIKVTEKMATGGVAGEDTSVSELNELNNWWRNQLATNWNE